MLKIDQLNLESQPWFANIEYMSYIGDLFVTSEVQALDDIIHHHISTRLQHSLRVSYVSYLTALSKGLDAKSCARAGLLHDLFYFKPKDVHFKRGSKFIHPRVALMNARQLTAINDTEADIIVHHMWLTGISTAFDMPRTREGRIVSMVDKQVAQFEARVMAKEKWNHRTVMQKLPNFQPIHL